MAQGARPQRAAGSLAAHRRGPRDPRQLREGSRVGRSRAHDVGRGDGDHRRRQPLHDREVRPRPHRGLFPDPRLFHGVLRRGRSLSLPDRRRAPFVLRLVLRPSAVVSPDLRRADRRTRVRGMVLLQLHHLLGHKHLDDAHPRRPLHDRGTLQRHEARQRLSRLLREHEGRGLVGAPQARHGCRLGARDELRHFQGVPPRQSRSLLHRLREKVHRPPHTGALRRARGQGCLRRGAHATRERPCAVRQRRQRRVEDGRVG